MRHLHFIVPTVCLLLLQIVACWPNTNRDGTDAITCYDFGCTNVSFTAQQEALFSEHFYQKMLDFRFVPTFESKSAEDFIVYLKESKSEPSDALSTKELRKHVIGTPLTEDTLIASSQNNQPATSRTRQISRISNVVDNQMLVANTFLSDDSDYFATLQLSLVANLNSGNDIREVAAANFSLLRPSNVNFEPMFLSNGSVSTHDRVPEPFVNYIAQASAASARLRNDVTAVHLVNGTYAIVLVRAFYSTLQYQSSLKVLAIDPSTMRIIGQQIIVPVVEDFIDYDIATTYYAFLDVDADTGEIYVVVDLKDPQIAAFEALHSQSMPQMKASNCRMTESTKRTGVIVHLMPDLSAHQVVCLQNGHFEDIDFIDDGDDDDSVPNRRLAAAAPPEDGYFPMAARFWKDVTTDNLRKLRNVVIAGNVRVTDGKRESVLGEKAFYQRVHIPPVYEGSSKIPLPPINPRRAKGDVFKVLDIAANSAALTLETVRDVVLIGGAYNWTKDESGAITEYGHSYIVALDPPTGAKTAFYSFTTPHFDACVRIRAVVNGTMETPRPPRTPATVPPSITVMIAIDQNGPLPGTIGDQQISLSQLSVNCTIPPLSPPFDGVLFVSVVASAAAVAVIVIGVLIAYQYFKNMRAKQLYSHIQ